MKRDERDVILLWSAFLIVLGAALIVLWCVDAYGGNRSLTFVIERPLPHYAELEIQRTLPGQPWGEASIARRAVDDYCRATQRRVQPPQDWQDIYDCGFSVTGVDGDYIYRARIVVQQTETVAGQVVVDWMPEAVWCVRAEPGGCPGYLAQEAP